MSTLDRPDLDEFLSALNGFLDKPTAVRDPGYLKFLEIFCRTVGAAEGHLLKPQADGRLASVVSFGIAADFDRAYNEHRRPSQPGPVESAFEEQRVVALVEVKPGAAPDWYTDLVGRHGFRSLIAVPLLGHSEAVGVLVAYYRDVCLFDQGTLDRLMVIGRMVGAATEKSAAAGRAETHDAKDLVTDTFLRLLTVKSLTKPQIFQYLVRATVEAVHPDGALAGPIRSMDDDPALTVAAGVGVPSSLMAHRVSLPRAAQRQIQASKWPSGSVVADAPHGGALSAYFRGTPSVLFASPLTFGGKIHGALLAWRDAARPFDADEERLMARLSAVASLGCQGV